MQSSPPENPAWHQREVQDLAQEHLVDPALGLHEAEALLRSERHGANELQASGKRGLMALLLSPLYLVGVWLGSKLYGKLDAALMRRWTLIFLIVVSSVVLSL